MDKKRQRAARKVAAELSQFVSSTAATGPLRCDVNTFGTDNAAAAASSSSTTTTSLVTGSSSSSQYEPLLNRMVTEPDFPSTILGIERWGLKFRSTLPTFGCLTMSDGNGNDNGNGTSGEGEKASFPYPVPGNDAERIEVLDSLLVMDTDTNNSSFDNVTKLASMLLNVPICLVSLVDAKRQWFKSKQGLDVPETERDVALCNYVILEESQNVVQMLPLRDPVLQFSPLVRNLPIGFYAGSPLLVNQHKIGTLCVLDHKERPYLTEREQEILKALSRFVVDLLLLHQKRAHEALKAQSLAKERGVLLRTLGSLSAGAFILDRTTPECRIVYANAGACKIYGCNEDQLLQQPFEEIVKGKNTKLEELDKLRSAIQFGNGAVVVIQSDRMSKYAFASTATLPSSAALDTASSFWAKYVITHPGSDPSTGMPPAEGPDWVKRTRSTDDPILLGNYCFVEITNEEKLAKASQEAEDIREEALIAMESRRVLMINLAREIRSKLDIIVQAGSKLLASAAANETNGDSEHSQAYQLSRLVVENGLYLTSLANTMAAHEMAAAGKDDADEDMEGTPSKKARRP